MKRWMVLCSAVTVAWLAQAGGPQNRAAAATSNPVIVDDFEGAAIDSTIWTTVDGDAWTTTSVIDTQNATHGAQSITSGGGTDAPTGTMTSAPITVPADAQSLAMDIRGLDGNPNDGSYPLHQNYVEVTDLGTGNVLANFVPPSSLGFTNFRVDVKALRGKQIQIKLVDGISGGWGWFGVDYIRFIPEVTAAPGEVLNGDFETGDLSGWTTTGPAWSVAPATYGGQGSATKHGQFFATSIMSGENSTGTLQSANFTVPADSPGLSFLIAGHSAYPGQTPANSYNYVEIRKAAGDTALARIYAPGGDNFVEKTVDLHQYAGQEVYIIAVDNGDLSAQGLNGFGWMAVDDFQLIKPALIHTVFDDFESGFFDPAKWTVDGSWEVVSAGQGWGGAPSQGTYCAKTSYDRPNNASSDALTGTLTSVPIPIGPDDAFLLFDMCGQDGPPSDADNNPLPPAGEVQCKIFDASNMDTPVATLEPPRQDSFTPYKFDVTPYRNKQLVLQLVDNRTQGFGWIGVDNIRIQYDASYVPVNRARQWSIYQ